MIPFFFFFLCIFFFFKQKTAYEMRISDWSSDVCSSDLANGIEGRTTSADVGRQERSGPDDIHLDVEVAENPALDGIKPATEDDPNILKARAVQLPTKPHGRRCRHAAAEKAGIPNIARHMFDCIILDAGQIGRAHV